MPPAYNPKQPSIIVLAIGAVLVVAWFPFSMVTGFLADGGANAVVLAGIFTMIFGPAALYLVFLVLGLRALKRTPGRKVFSLIALLSTPIMIGLGILLVAIGSTIPKG